MINKIYNEDCILTMSKMCDNYVDMILTDIPYDGVNRKSNGLRNLDKENADVITFNLQNFLKECYRVTKSTIIIFCGQTQISEIFSYFNSKSSSNLGTTRQLVWAKTNPSPMNGEYIYLSAVENAIWFKKRGGTFNAHCKKNYFIYPNGRSKLHPTEKNISLISELILDNTNPHEIIYDPCSGSGTTAASAIKNDRRYIGSELDKKYFDISIQRVNSIL